MYSYEIEGSCPFKIRPKLLSLINKANPIKKIQKFLTEEKLKITA